MLAPAMNGAPRGLLPAVVTARGGERGVTYRSGSAHVQHWTGLDIPVEVHAERLRSAYRAWVAASKDGIPRLSEMMNSEANVAVNDTLLFLKVNDDFLVVSQGADHIRHIGSDLRGRLSSEFNVPVSHVLKQLYDKCLAQKEAVYARFVSDLAPDSVYWEGLFVPLKADAGGNAHFVMTYNTPIDSKADIFQMILDRSPMGIIAAVPLGERGGSVDGRIILINARAKELLKFDDNGSRVHFIHELAPWFRDISGWTRSAITTEGEKTCIRYCDKSNRRFSVTMEALKRFVLFRISQIGDAEAGHSPGTAS